MNGLLVYQREDAARNKDYIRWLQDAASDQGMTLTLCFSDDVFRQGIPQTVSFSFVINRSRSYELSVLFELNGYRVFNPSEVTRLGNHKLAAYRYAQTKGISFAPVYVSWSHVETVISKPISGHGGAGIQLVSGAEVFEETRLQQEFRTDVDGDIRFYIMNNQIIHAVIRRAKNGFLSNFSQGGSIEAFGYSKTEEALVQQLISGLPIDYAGVDFLLLKDRCLLFNELEDAVGSRMLSVLGKNDTTQLFLEHIKKTLTSG
jgi:gamma-F420-2:alpha-L-glutamate ligase